MEIKSHIQAPKSVLGRFIDEKYNKVHYIDVISGRLGLCGAKVINRELGWYSEQTEKALNDNVENPFSRLCNRIIKCVNSEDDLIVSSDDNYIVKKYIASSIGRSDLISRSFDNHFSKFDLNPQFKHDKLVELSLKISAINDDSFSLLWGIIENKATSSLILPRNCLYYVSDEDFGNPIVMPISPRVAIGVFSEDYFERHPSFINERIVGIYDDKTIKHLNSKAIQYEVVMNGKFAVSSRIDDLTDAWEQNKDKIADLLSLRNQLSK